MKLQQQEEVLEGGRCGCNFAGRLGLNGLGCKEAERLGLESSNSNIENILNLARVQYYFIFGTPNTT